MLQHRSFYCQNCAIFWIKLTHNLTVDTLATNTYCPITNTSFFLHTSSKLCNCHVRPDFNNWLRLLYRPCKCYRLNLSHQQFSTAFHHGLHGSAGRQLALSVGDGNFQPPQNPHPLNDHQKVCYRWLSAAGSPYSSAKFSVNPSIGGFWANVWNMTKFFICLLTTFLWELTYRSDLSKDFHSWWLKQHGLAHGCAFWGFCWYCSPFWGKIPQKNNFWGVNGHFQAKLAKSWKFCIIEATASISTKFCNDTDHQVVIACGPTRHQQIQDGGHPPFEQETPLSQMDHATCHVSWNCAKCCTNVHRIAFESCNRQMTFKVIQAHWKHRKSIGHMILPICSI